MAANVCIQRYRLWGEVEFVRVSHLPGPVFRQVSLACKFVYFEQGTRHFHYCRRRLTADEGSLLLIPPGEVHGADAPEEGQSSLRIVSVPIQVIAHHADSRDLPALVLQRIDDPFITHPVALDVFHRLHRPVGEFVSGLEMQSLLALLLNAVALPDAHSSGTASKSCREAAPIRRVKEYLDAHYAEEITLDQLAQAACLVPTYLCRVFARSVGMPPHAYQNAVRIAHARDLLGHGLSVGQVAQATGFYDQSHFSRHFARAVRMPPAQYARQVKNVQDSPFS